MKTIYLCGAINGCTDEQAKGWREQVKEALKGKYEFLDPMSRDFRGKEVESVSQIVHGDLADIAASDIILVMANQPSWGTAMEMVYAHQAPRWAAKEIVVVCDKERPSPWLVYHADIMVDTLDNAIKHLLGEELP